MTKIAIICDWLVVAGGAEKVLSELFHCFPQADLYAVIDYFDESTRHALNIPPAKTSFLQKIPYIKYCYRYALPIMPLAIEQLDVSAYDLILSSSHSVAKGIKTHSKQKHICYIHSPMRYAWDLKDQYLSRLTLKQKLFRPLMNYFLEKIRLWDSNNSKYVHHFIANSNYIATRVFNAYGRTADVVYPPIDTDYFVPGTAKKDFFLAASRLVSYKRLDIIVKCFSALPDKQLVIIGDGPEMKVLKNMATSNVTFLGFQSNTVLKRYLQEARAFIFAAEEDFGILPLEAQACGTPVIAYGKGGALETVRHLTQAEPTGIHFEHQTCESLREAIHQFEENIQTFTPQACRGNALRFSTKRFREHILQIVHTPTALNA